MGQQHRQQCRWGLLGECERQLQQRHRGDQWDGQRPLQQCHWGQLRNCSDQLLVQPLNLVLGVLMWALALRLGPGMLTRS